MLRHTEKPVLVVPEGADDTEIETVLLPVDFSEQTTGALTEALELVRAFGASAQLAHVLSPREKPEAAMAALEEKAAIAKDAGVQATVHLIEEHHDAAEALCEFADKGDPSLIIMSAHGYHGFSRLMLGSVTEKVIQQSYTPVMVLKPEQTFGELNASLS